MGMKGLTTTMKNQKIVRYNIIYMVLVHLIPIALCIGVFALRLSEPVSITLALACFGLLIFGERIIFWFKQKSVEKELNALGFSKNYTFSASSSILYIDINNGNIAMACRWNPFKLFVVSAKNITEAKTEDCRSGKGMMEGTNAVRFMFKIDGKKYRVYTFRSNKQRYAMNSQEVLTGISKADSAVEYLLQAQSVGL